MKISSKRQIGLVLVLLSGAAPPAGATDAQRTTPSSTAFQERLAILDRQAATIHDLSATFVESKYTALLRKPLTSKGSIRVVGSRVLWETREPYASQMLIDKTHLRIHYPKRNTVEVYPLDDRFDQLFATPVPRLLGLRGRFDIEPMPPERIDAAFRETEKFFAVRMTTADESLRRYIERIDVVIDISTACAVSVDMLDADGERTAISFSNIKTNRGLNEQSVGLKLPSGTRVIHPLSRDAQSAGGAESQGDSP